MTLECVCNGRYLHLNFDVTSCDFHHHVTSVKAVITILPREVITVRSLISDMKTVCFIPREVTIHSRYEDSVFNSKGGNTSLQI
jgi:hypothetical protein